MHGLVIPALASGFSDAVHVADRLKAVRIEDNEHAALTPPHTIDQGAGKPPVVVMGWNGKIDDVVCMAHEMSHALQIVLSDSESTPPVAREVCAFIGELLLLSYAKTHDNKLFERLHRVWQQENTRYLVSDLEQLADKLKEPQSPYFY